MKASKQPRRYRTLDGIDGSPAVRVLVVESNGHEGYVARWTQSCSGCFESIEGYPPNGATFDAKAQCYVGSGCSECGYTGKRREAIWMPFDSRVLFEGGAR